MRPQHPLSSITDDLVAALKPLRFAPPVTHVYNPLEYARTSWDDYLRLAGTAPKEVVLVGMNPGPWGMAQTGVPFGAVGDVAAWLGIRGEVGRPPVEHPKRPVLGWACPRAEVSGTRVWGWARGTFGTPERFFARFFIANYCPLLFLEASGKNRTPDQLPASEREPLIAACDEALRRTVGALQPAWVVGIGNWAEARARAALGGMDVRIGRIAHPSPASPIANRGWEPLVNRELAELGIRL